MYIDHSRDRLDEKLYIVAAISNPCRYESRYRLYEQFVDMVSNTPAILYTVEIAHGRRRHAVTRPDNPRHIQLRSDHTIWTKERLLNIGISRLPRDWRYVSTVDPDISFCRPDWVHETLQQLQMHNVVQMFSEAVDLGPNYEQMSRHEGFVYQYKKDQHVDGGTYSQYSHPGFSWAYRRTALEDLGGLIDWAILGAGDRHQAYAFINRVLSSCDKDLHTDYKTLLLQWQERAEKYVRRNIGYVKGTIYHYWHGPKVQRKYHDRWKILVDYQFSPKNDLKPDVQGLYQLVDHGDLRSVQFRDALVKYFAERNEDSIDTK